MLILAILERWPLVTLVCGSFEFHLSKSKPIYYVYVYIYMYMYTCYVPTKPTYQFIINPKFFDMIPNKSMAFPMAFMVFLRVFHGFSR